MTVQMLIERLNTFDPKTPVVMGLNLIDQNQELTVQIEEIEVNPLFDSVELIGRFSEEEYE